MLERLQCRPASEPGCEPFARQAFEYTKEQLKEVKVWGRTILCRLCQDPEAWWDMDSGTPTCSSCGAEDANVPSDQCEKRFFADEEKQERDAKKRNDEYMDEENYHLSKILAREMPGSCTQEDLWAANNRLNQCVVWLEMLLRDESHGGFRLTHSEVRTGRIVLRAVCVQWAKEGFADENFGSPILWAIGIALQLVAMRPGGFAMPTPQLCARVTLQGLHTWLKRYRSDAVFMAYESTLSMTKVRGTEARMGQLAAEHRVRRHAAFHELGNTAHKRYKKMLVLHKLLVNSKVWGGEGLDERVLKLKSPTLTGVEQPKVRVWPVRRKLVGVHTATAERSDTDTDAEDSVPASPAYDDDDAVDGDDATVDGDASDGDWELSEADEAQPAPAPAQKRPSPPLGGGCCDERPPFERESMPAPMPVTEMPYAAENLAIPPGGESGLADMDQQLQVAEQLADPLAHAALVAAAAAGDDDDDASVAVPEDIDLPDDVWEQQVEEERVAIEAEEAEKEAQAQAEAQAEAVKAQEAIEANAFAAAEACLLGFAPLAPLEPVDAQPPKLKPALKREPIPLRKLKTATLTQVLACSQYWQKDAAKAHAFYQRWKEESKAHREVVRLALEEKNRKDKAFAEAKAAREAKQAAAAAARAKKEAEAREARGWNQLMSQGAKKEKAEARLARGKGACYVVPTEETNDKKAGTIAPIRVGQLLPSIKIPTAVLQKLEPQAPPEEIEVGEIKAVRVKLAGTARPLRRALPGKRKAPEEEEAPAGDDDPYARKFKPRRRAAT